MNRTELFNKALQDAGLSQAEYVRLTGHTQQTVSRWQTGKRKPIIEVILFAKALSVLREQQLDELFDGIPLKEL